MKTLTRLLSTSEVANAAGVGRETLRFYEEKGLVEPIGRTQSGYRQYASSAVQVIAFIKQSQLAGLSIKEIQELVNLRTAARHTCGNVGDALDRKLNSLDAEIEGLQRKRALLVSMKNDCCQPQRANDCCALVP